MISSHPRFCALMVAAFCLRLQLQRELEAHVVEEQNRLEQQEQARLEEEEEERKQKDAWRRAWCGGHG